MEAPAVSPDATPIRHRPSGLHATGLLFAVVVAAQLALLWAFPYPPTQDGAVHLETARLLLAYGSHGGAELHRWFELDRWALSTLLPTLALSALLAVAPSAAAAEKLFTSAYVLLFAWGVRRALPGREEAPFALLALPFALGYLFHLGFYSFGFGVAGLLALVSRWLRRGDGAFRAPAQPPHLRGALADAAALALVWLAHPVAGLAGGVVLVARAATSWRQMDRRRLLHLAVALLPIAALTLHLRWAQGPTTAVHWPLSRRLAVLGTLDVLSSFDPRERLLSLAVAALLAGLILVAGFRRRQETRRGADFLLLAATALLALALVLPNHQLSAATGSTRGGWVVHRLGLLVPLLALCWLGRQPLGDRIRRWAAVAGLVCAAAQLAVLVTSYLRIHAVAADLAGAEAAIPPGATYLPISLADRGAPGLPVSSKVAVLQHAGSRLAADSPRIDLGNYQAAAHGLFPIAFRAALDPGTKMPRLPGVPAGSGAGDFTAFEAATGVEVDYVLVWGWRPAAESDPRMAPLTTRLGAGYELVHTSPRGWLHIYRRLSADAAAPATAPR